MLCRWMKIWIWMNARVTLSFFLHSWFSTVLYLFLYYLILSIYHFKTIETIIQPLNMLLYHIVDFDRGSMFWVQQASWAKLYNLRKIGFFVYAFFKTSSFSNGSFVYFLIFIYILGGKCQSLRLMRTPAKFLLNTCQNRNLKQTPADPAICVPHFLLQSRICEIRWLSVYICLCVLSRYFLSSIKSPSIWVTLNLLVLKF